MRFFHDQVKTDCVYCHGGGCLHCANRQLERITGEVAVGILDVEQLERLIDCLNGRPQLVLKLTIAVPGPGAAAAVWERFCKGKRPSFLGDAEGGMFAQPGEVPVPAGRGGRGRVRDLLAQIERLNPEPQELQHARRMLRQWEGHSTGYAAERAAYWRAEVARLEGEFEHKETKEAKAGPVRVVLSRAKGWRMPENTVKVDRATRWGNPFKVGSRVTGVPGLCRGAGMEHELKTAAEAVHCYGLWLAGEVNLYDQRPPSRGLIQEELRGKNLACWCKAGDACHADVLLGIANGGQG